MSAYAVTALMFVSMLVLMGTGLPIVYCLGSVGTLAAALLWGDGALDIVYFSTLELMNNMVLSAVPLFIFMGFVLHESKIAKDLFDTVYLWSGRLRGALGIGTVLAAFTMGKVIGWMGEQMDKHVVFTSVLAQHRAKLAHSASH